MVGYVSMVQILFLDALTTMIPPVVGLLFLTFSEMLLYMLKKYIQSRKEDFSPSNIVTWFGESYNVHSRFWNATRYLSWTLGAVIIGLWLQDFTANDYGLLIGIFLMFRFAGTLSMSESATYSLLTKDEKETHQKETTDKVAWKVFIKHYLKQSINPAEDFRRSITMMHEQNVSKDIILQILAYFMDREDEVGDEAKQLMSEIQSI
jgi:hypothetical protein